MSTLFVSPDIAGQLADRPCRWVVTGAAGFIGSHLLEQLLRAGQQVTSIDNFSTGKRANLDEVRRKLGESAWSRHRFIEGDIADPKACAEACDGASVILHQAAIGSVPRSIADPMETHRSNLTGFLEMLVAARNSGARRFVYACSSSTYGDSPVLPSVEDKIGRPLSPYAVTKYANELYAEVFSRSFGIQTIGLRYFNVFGPRQDPNGAYAAVIPCWFNAMVEGAACVINGDGETSRDFCFVANVVQANLRAALVEDEVALNQIYNVAVGARTTLRQLHGEIAAALGRVLPSLEIGPPQLAEFRQGDVRHSVADIGKARELLGYRPTHTLREGLAEAVEWYAGNGMNAHAGAPA
ncbi:MAG: SDR family oxidoreductase [Caldimonas sp.]